MVILINKLKVKINASVPCASAYKVFRQYNSVYQVQDIEFRIFYLSSNVAYLRHL
jgi:hypothetical protein